MLDEDEKPIGSLLIIEAVDLGVAPDKDPYSKTGVFERIDIRPWRPAPGSWVD